MPKWVRDLNGRVMEVVTTDPSLSFADPKSWIRVPKELDKWIDIGGFTIDEGQIKLVNLEPLLSAMEKAIADKRLKEQTRGAHYRGRMFSTDPDNMANMATHITLAKSRKDRGKSFKAVWKTKDGFLEVNLKELIEASHTTQDHVMACFKRESEIIFTLRLESKKPNATAYSMCETFDSEINAGWPAYIFQLDAGVAGD